jgi:hypothetical protein
LKYLKILFVVLFGLSFGWSFSFVGVLYFGDLVIFCVLLFSFFKVVQGQVRFHREVLFFLSLPAVGLVWDLFNYVPLDDTFRGLARNGIFGASVVVGAFFMLKIGFSTLWYLYVSVCISLVVWSVAYDPYIVSNLTSLLKYYGGSYSFIFVQTVIKRVPILQIIMAFLISVTCFLFLDSRGGALIWGTIGLSVIGILTIGKFILRRYLLLHVIAVTTMILGLGIINYSKYLNIELRRSESSRLRWDMAYDALLGFLDSPWLGNGSWQHARVYVDINDPNLETGVHSYILQLAYEYGLFGLFFGFFALFVLFRNFKEVLRMFVNGRLSQANLFMLTYLYIFLVYGIINSPFAGYSRIIIGMGIGILAIAGRSNHSLQN